MNRRLQVAGCLVSMLVAHGCATNRVLDANWQPFLDCSLGIPASPTSCNEEALLLLAIGATPYLVLASTVTVALAVDVVTSPYQLLKGDLGKDLRELGRVFEDPGG